ncbi:MAG: acylneuraminate cytidylyltransferase family protein [Campylobacterota bacterium]|nr:acylneuraminate cytidylyltransferase family protein [Campylobacterota bacterium]
MYKNKRIIAIIPARKGSVGLKNKNTKELCGKPLIAHSIEKAKSSKYIDEVMVTTDCDRITSIAKEYGANIPFTRPAKLSSSTATSLDVVLHTLNYYETNFDDLYDYLILLEPTSPLREDDDIDNMIEKLINNEKKYDSLTSIGEVNEHPSIVKKIKNNNLIPFCEELELTSRRQDNETAYFPYGVGYLVKTASLKKEKMFYTRRNDFYTIKKHQCYEIDDIYDFICVEAIMTHQNSKGDKDAI